ncbi:MAG: WGR domain-containing protein [Acetobacteraceae bacterium]
MRCANEWRYYRLAVWPDLFGRALVARQWGRIGTQGHVRLDPHPDAGAAATGIGLGDGASTRVGRWGQSSEGAALALPPGPRRPWTRHPKGMPPLPRRRPAALHPRRRPEICHHRKA